MNKVLITLLILFLNGLSFADDAKVPCRYKDGTLGLNTLETYDCKMANFLSTGSTIQKEYKEYVDKKLAIKITQKASDLIEDLSLLDSYFDMNDIDLGDNKDVKEFCKMEVIADPACGNTHQTEEEKKSMKKKMEYMLSSDKYLPKSNELKKGLYGKMVSKAKQIRNGSKLKEKNQCPVDGNSGDFTLSSQLTFNDSEKLLESLKVGNGTIAVSRLYEKYPQLKIYMSKSDQKKKFEDFIKSSEKGGAKLKIDSYFKQKEIQEEMASNVADKCKELKNTISSFICKETYPHLAMRTDERESFFNEKSEDDQIFKEVSRGVSCQMEESNQSEANNDVFSKLGTIQEKNERITLGVREPKRLEQVEKILDPFCSLYLCKSKDIKQEMLSCKNGGPINSADILLTCAGSDLKSCDTKTQQYYSYLKSMERDAINSGVNVAGSVDSNFSDDSSESKKPRGFTSFYQNLLGVEGTIASEGKVITPVTIAEKKAEFTERKLDISSSQSGSLTRGKETVAVEVRPEPIAREMVASESDEHSASVRQADEYRRAFQSQNFSKPNYEINKDANGKTKKVKFTDTDSSTIDEMKKLRTELADALGKVKGTEEEQLAAVADNNASIVAPKAVAKSTAKNLSNGEKERLDAYRDSLNNWENKLRDWQENISDRQVRANNGGGAVGADSRSENTVTNGDQANNRGSASGAKLTKSGATGATGVNGKADGSAERAPGADGSDAEAGIVNSEKLATLEKDSLKKLGIVVTDSFIIKVRHKDKIYSVPVKTYNHGGKEMYVPLLNDKDRELSKIVYESPLFKDYREFQVQRQYKLDQIQ